MNRKNHRSRPLALGIYFDTSNRHLLLEVSEEPGMFYIRDLKNPEASILRKHAYISKGGDYCGFSFKRKGENQIYFTAVIPIKYLNLSRNDLKRTNQAAKG